MDEMLTVEEIVLVFCTNKIFFAQKTRNDLLDATLSTKRVICRSTYGIQYSGVDREKVKFERIAAVPIEMLLTYKGHQ